MAEREVAEATQKAEEVEDDMQEGKVEKPAEPVAAGDDEGVLY